MTAIALLFWHWIIGHSPKQLMIAGGIFAVTALAMWGIHHERQIGRDQVKVELQKADDANAAFVKTVAALKASMAECESNRLIDQNLQRDALAQRDADAKKLTAAATTARAKLDAVLAGRCKAWASQPACVQ